MNYTCHLAAYYDLGWRMFWAPRASGYKWQYILLPHFLVFTYITPRLNARCMAIDSMIQPKLCLQYGRTV